MPHRQFVDDDGALWAVWDVRPAPGTMPASQPESAPRARGSRALLEVENALSAGWLCFESGGQKRRLAPIPPHWESLPPPDLVRLCQAAAPVRRRDRGDPSGGDHSAA
jgi:hypothetical protein